MKNTLFLSITALMIIVGVSCKQPASKTSTDGAKHTQDTNIHVSGFNQIRDSIVRGGENEQTNKIEVYILRRGHSEMKGRTLFVLSYFKAQDDTVGYISITRGVNNGNNVIDLEKPKMTYQINSDGRLEAIECTYQEALENYEELIKFLDEGILNEKDVI